MLFEYTDDDGKVVERVRPAADSPYEQQLAERAADAATGWAQVDEDAAAEQAPARSPRGRAAAADTATEVPS